MSERRPNPEGWVPPRAPYNPYDSTDTRPPQGYPSEFNTPGKQRSWTVRPKEPENYRIVKDQLKRLQYTPRPLSDIYPGQYKVLRRSDTGAFTKGIRITSLLLSSGLIFFGVFFYRWNDGYENVFSGPYRVQLRVRDALFGNLSETQKEDLAKPRYHGMTKKMSGTTAPEPTFVEPKGSESDDGAATTLQRPQRMHYVEAERIRQEREEAILRAVDIAEEQLKKRVSQQQQATGAASVSTDSSKSRWKFW